MKKKGGKSKGIGNSVSRLPMAQSKVNMDNKCDIPTCAFFFWLCKNHRGTGCFVDE